MQKYNSYKSITLEKENILINLVLLLWFSKKAYRRNLHLGGSTNQGYKQNNNFDDYTTILWVISTCDNFSEEAIQEASTNGIKLINGKEFVRMILDAGLGGLNL